MNISLKGLGENILTLDDDVIGFKRKLNLWKFYVGKNKTKKQPQAFSTTDYAWGIKGNQVKSQVTERVNCEIELTAFAFPV